MQKQLQLWLWLLFCFYRGGGLKNHRKGNWLMPIQGTGLHAEGAGDGGDDGGDDLEQLLPG